MYIVYAYIYIHIYTHIYTYIYRYIYIYILICLHGKVVLVIALVEPCDAVLLLSNLLVRSDDIFLSLECLGHSFLSDTQRRITMLNRPIAWNCLEAHPEFVHAL